MIVHPTPIEGLLIIEPAVFEDERGYFYESFNQRKWEETTGLNTQFVQDNQARSSMGVLRGLHFQKGDAAQAKLVRCIEGVVFDLAVDLRANSPTYKKWFGLELSEENHLQFFIPRGFAHGYLVLSESATFSYKCDNFYNKEAESGLRYDDPEIGINWPKIEGGYTLSSKDLNW
ncbi:MAG: dTDP-4-dehydrorhamnose 3,5-epimerase [Bacteroidota bacterium]